MAEFGSGIGGIGGKISSGISSALGKISDFSGRVGNAFGQVASGMESFVAKFQWAAIAVGAALVFIGSRISSAVERVDTLVNFPKLLESMGATAEDAKASTSRLSEALRGLPTPLQDGAQGVERLVAAGLSVPKATEAFLAMNNALIVGGASAQDTQVVMQSLTRAISAGTVDATTMQAALSRMPTVLQALSRETGKSAGELFNLYSQNPQKLIDDMIRLNKDGSGSMKSLEVQAREATGGIGTAWENLKNSIDRAWVSIVKRIGGGDLESGQKKISNLISDIGKQIEQVFSGDFSSAIGTATAALTGLITAWGFAKVAATAFNEVSLVTYLATQLMAGGFEALTLAMDTNPLMLIVTAITAVIAALVFLELKFHIFSKLLAVIKPVGEAIYNFLKPAFDAFVKTLKDVWTWISINILPTLQQLWQKFVQIWTALITQLKPAFDQFLKALEPYWPLIQKLLIAFSVFAALIVGVVVVAILLVAMIFLAVVKAILNFGQMLQAGWNAFWNAIKSIANSVWNAIKSTVQSGINFVRGVVSGGVGFIVRVWNGITRIVGIAAGAIGGVVRAISGGLRSAYNAAAGFIGGFVNVGRDIVNGIVRGIQSLASDPIRALVNIGTDAINAVKHLLHIGSPSRLFAEQVGLPISQGIAQGINNGAGLVDSALSAVVPKPSTINGQMETTHQSQRPISITVNMDGIMTRSRSDLRAVAADLVASLNEELRSRNQQLIPNVPT